MTIDDLPRQWTKNIRIQEIIDKLHEINVRTEAHWIELADYIETLKMQKHIHYRRAKIRRAALVAGFLLLIATGAYAQQTQTVRFNLSWTNGTPLPDNSNVPDGTKIERSLGSVGPWTPITIVPWAGNTFQDSIPGDPGNKIYCYRAKATKSVGATVLDSAYSNTACASSPTIPPLALAPPTKLLTPQIVTQ